MTMALGTTAQGERGEVQQQSAGGQRPADLQSNQLAAIESDREISDASAEELKSLTKSSTRGGSAEPASLAADAVVANRTGARGEATLIPPGVATPESTVSALGAAAPSTSSVSLIGAANTASAAPAPSGLAADVLSAPGTVRLGSSSAAESMAAPVRWMTAGGRTTANVEVSPAELGPVTIELESNDGRLGISLHAGIGATRDLLEALAPRLRELLTGDGFDEVSVDVGDRQADSSDSRGARGEDRAESSSIGGGDERSDTESTQSMGRRSSLEERAADRDIASLLRARDASRPLLDTWI